MSDITSITTKDLHTALEAMTAAAAVIKRRFPNLSVNEANMIAKEVVYAIKSVTQ